MTCFAAKHSKFGVGGCCRLDLFSLKKYYLQEFLDVKNNFWRQVCFSFSKREICLKVGKNEI